jgi:3-phenylpropionate/trans-cinnamate dioxygenase ferredoxin subunit
MEKASDHNWHKIAESMDEFIFQANGLTELQINGKMICIGKHNNRLFACTQKCPHAGGILADGYIDSTGNLVCPLHRYKFNPENGRNISGEGYFLKTFLIEERADGIFIYLEAPTFF